MCRAQALDVWILYRLVLPGALIIKVDGLHRNACQQMPGRRLDQHRRWRAVLQDVRNPLRRIGRIQRYITTPRLEDRQQADDHIRTALNADADAGIRLNALLNQRMRQAVGLLVKLAICNALHAMDHCQRLRSTLHLRFEQPMDGLLMRIIQLGSVEPEHQLLTLCCRQNRQTGQRHFAGLLQCTD